MRMNREPPALTVVLYLRRKNAPGRVYGYTDAMAASRVRKIVIPIAGLGSRMLPATKCVSKELLTVVDRPVIHYIALEAAASGVRELIFVAREKNPSVLRYLRRHRALETRLAAAGDAAAVRRLVLPLPSGVRLRVTVQPRPRGLGDAVLWAREAVGRSPFGVMLPDVILYPAAQGMPRLVDCFDRLGESAILVHPVPGSEVQRYGIADFVPGRGKSGARQLRGVVEKPPPARAPSRFAVTGRYLFTPDVFDFLQQTVPGRNGEVQLTDAIAALAQRKSVWALTMKRGTSCYDCGTPFGLTAASMEFALRDPKTVQPARELIRRLS